MSFEKLMKFYETFSPRRTPCWLARKGVALAGSLDSAVSMALSRGNKQADIDYMIKKCGLH
jgi:hypothetical protein